MVNFLKYRWLYLVISTAVIGSGLFSIVRWGFRYSIDFVGGTNLEYQIDKKIDIEKTRLVFEKNKVEIINISEKDKQIFLRTKTIDEQMELKIRKELERETESKITTLRFETVGPIIGKETIRKTLVAMLLAILGILIYMSFAFKSINFAFAAIVALVHDFFVVIGTYSLISHFFQAELDILFVTALLITMSFSVHDTIVIFDKIREYETGEREEIEQFANIALTETMVRSFNNSMTIVFMLMALILLGGTTIRFFIWALLVGTITGTYSSPFVATPVLVWLSRRSQQAMSR